LGVNAAFSTGYWSWTWMKTQGTFIFIILTIWAIRLTVTVLFTQRRWWRTRGKGYCCAS
jgi:hypothetical protein